MPRLLTGLYFLAGAAALFAYLLPELAGLVVLLGFILSLWQGILFWKQDTRPTAAGG